LSIIGLIYPVSKFCQALIVGPIWVRWWLTDFGFVICLTLIYLSILEIKNKWSLITNFRTPLIKSGVFALLFSVIVEISQLLVDYLLKENNLTVQSKMVARGDYNDFVMYIFGFLVILIVALDPSLNKKVAIIENKKTKVSKKKSHFN